MAKKKKKPVKFEKRVIYAPKRIENELKLMKEYSYILPQFRNLVSDERDPMHWTALIVPDGPLYNKGAFQIDIRFPREYPFKPPRIMFMTKIYHPNIDEMGRICLPCIAVELWKPTTRMHQVMQALVALVNDPDPYDAIAPKFGEEYLQRFNNFKLKALLMTRKFALQRPRPLRPQKPGPRFGPLARKPLVE